METVPIALWVVVLLVVMALLFDFMNGFHDAANSIATIVSTGVLKPYQAVAWAAFFNVVALFFFELKVASTVGKGMVDLKIVTPYVILAGLMAVPLLGERFRPSLVAGGAGAMAGLAGMAEVAGAMGQLTPKVGVGHGFAAIIVAFVGRLHPVGMVCSAVLLSMFYIGGEMAQSRMGLPKSITGVFQGMLLFCLLACDTLITHRLRWRAA